MSHELAETAFWKGALLEPDEVFLREIENRDAAGWILLFSEHAERHMGTLDFREQVSEVFAVDFCEIHDG